MTNRPWEVYGLSDPRTGKLRYVGVTFRGRRRLNEHLSRAVTGRGRTHRDCWLRSLLRLGLRPVLSVLEAGSGEGWQERERYWIALHRPAGDLVNHTDGGEGTPGYVPTLATRAKWSAMRRGVKYRPGRRGAMLGRRHSASARLLIAAASTGRLHTLETRARIALAATERGVPRGTVEASAASRRGVPLTDEHRQKIAATTTNRKPVVCVETGDSFPSITAAARALGVNEASVYQAIRKGCRCKGNHYRLG